MKLPEDKRAFKKAFWKSVSSFIGIFMGAGAGSMIHQATGGQIKSVTIGLILAIVSWLLILYSEYNREK